VKLTIEPLDDAVHDRGAFSCGKDDLDRFLRETSGQASRAFRSQTFVLASPDHEPPRAIMGFYTLALHEYRDGEMDPTMARTLKVRQLGRFPVILLAQLAVAGGHQKAGFGRLLLDHALKRSLLVGHHIGGVAIVTDPIDHEAAAFYQHYGFAELPGGRGRLILPMKTVARAYPAVASAARASTAS
jgi:GNAT superfamily N-acetyltransferase